MKISLLIVTAAALILGTTSLLSQPIARLWSVPLPTMAKNLTYSQDGMRYAYMVDSIIVRCNALTGEPIDSVVVPTASDIQYCDARLYVSIGEVMGTKIGFLDDSLTALQMTDLMFGPSFAVGGYSQAAGFSLFATPNVPILIVSWGEYIVQGSSSYSKTSVRFISTVDHSLLNLASGPSSLAVASADGSSLAWISQSSFGTGSRGGQGGSSGSTQTCVEMVWPIQSTPVQYAISRSVSSAYPYSPDRLPFPKGAQFSKVVPTGFPGIVYLNNVLVDLRYAVGMTADSTQPVIVGNLGPNGRMLGYRNINDTVALYDYDAVRQRSDLLDTLHTKPYFSTHIVTEHRAMFLYDGARRLLFRYQLQASTPTDTIRVGPLPDTVNAEDTIACSADVMINRHNLRFAWYDNGLLVATTSNPWCRYLTNYAGEHIVHVEALDTNGTIVQVASARRSVIVRSAPHGSTNGVRNVAGFEGATQMFAAPNPCTDYINVYGPSEHALSNATCYAISARGERVSIEYRGERQFSLSSVAPGAYFVVVVTAEGLWTARILKLE